MKQTRIELFGELKREVLRHPRIAGIFIIEASVLPIVQHVAEREFAMRNFVRSVGFSEADNGDDEWKDAETCREDAVRQLAMALEGGTEIGHSSWDVEPELADVFAERFVSLFGAEGRFFCASGAPPIGRWQAIMPSAHPEFKHYIFGGGCVAYDATLCAVPWTLDSD